jgi:glucan phosphoethanolaminetransferase (alkaline phosphatase superfamily)
MVPDNSQKVSGMKESVLTRFFYGFLVRRAYSVIMLVALLCTLFVKLFHAYRYRMQDYYFGWILADVSFLLGMEVVLALVCFHWSKKWVIRTATVVAGVMCTWSFLNAGWLIRTGTQILPRVLLPLFRAPINCLSIVGVNMIKMPAVSIFLLAPGIVALAFFIYVLARSVPPVYNKKHFVIRITLSILIVLTAVAVRPMTGRRSSPPIASKGLRNNAQIRAVLSLFMRDYSKMAEPKRKIPLSGKLEFADRRIKINHNVLLVVLEGVQYRYTSLSDESSTLTPYLASFAEQGATFTNARSALSHTTKALFALLTGRYPSASQDLAEAVPVVKPYASIATILRNNLNYRSAFFQSAMGTFESRPGLVANLGFDKFWAREDLNDPNSYIGYLACDEFSTLKPIIDWIKAEERPFFLTFLCSVTHDPYEVPEWYGTPDKEPVGRYRQSISYTDDFLASLDVALKELNISDETILCIVGDHGEAFGEHGQLGHALIAFEEALRIPFCIRAPFLIEPGTKVTKPVSSVDLTPTLLTLLGFDTASAAFDGIDVLGNIPDDRKVYFTGWMQEGPAGFVQGDRKIICDPTNKTTYCYKLNFDPMEMVRIELPEQQAKEIDDEITAWRSGTILNLAQTRTGKKVVYDDWLCRWTNRTSSAKYIKKETDNN